MTVSATYTASAWTPSFYSYDGMGSVRQLTNTTGAVTDSYDYDAFGNLLTPMGPTPNEFLFRGEQWDSDLTLYYLRARYMNPLTGWFMSRDPNDPQLPDANGTPIDPRGFHKYLYTGGDPVDRLDPTGRASSAEYEEEEETELTVQARRIAKSALKLQVWIAGGSCVYIASRELIDNPVLDGIAEKVLDAGCVFIGTAAFILGP